MPGSMNQEGAGRRGGRRRRHAAARAAPSGVGIVMLLAVASLLILPAGASASARVAIGDQKPVIFDDARLGWLGIRHARTVVAWDWYKVGYERERLDEWLERASRAGIEPLVAFGHSWEARRLKQLPTVAQYRHSLREFRRRHPWVRVYSVWNEANHCSQPTCKRPRRAAAYYNAMRSLCRGCRIVAADVLDQPNMVPWLREFRRHAKGEPRLWGLHNYLDANRFRRDGTRRMLRAVRGEIWFTETGGIVRRRHFRQKIRLGFPESPSHAGRATAWILRLSKMSPRIKRIYLYHWSSTSPDQRWDSGLISWNGRARPAFDVVARHRGLDPRKAPRRDRPPDPPDGTPLGPGGDGVSPAAG
jgi:hypothetical protein